MQAVSKVLSFLSQHFPKFSSRVLASSGYTLDLDRFGGSTAFTIWTEPTARRQDRAWQPIVAEAKNGHPREDVSALYDALDAVAEESASILEVGSGGGHVSEVIAHRYPALRYSGIDLSPPMIAIAAKQYPDRQFSVGSAYELPLPDHSLDIVLDGVALIHMPDWTKALDEYARVSRRNVILHGVTLTDSVPTTRFAKYAYGQPSMEFVFNRAELLSATESRGLSLLRSFTGLDYDLADYIGIQSESETWVLVVEGVR